MARGSAERSTEEALFDLLISLYDDNVDGLVRFIRFGAEGERVVLDIPGANAPLSTIIGQVVASLKRHGLIDRVLFERLEAVFPRRVLDIRATRDRWGLSPAPGRRSATEAAQDNEAMELQRKQLADALRRKAALADAREDTDAVDEEIKEIKRSLRQGPLLRQGVVLGRRYWLLNQLGSGGFGTVWRAHDRNTDTIVAIKVLHPQEAQDLSKRERFFRGARAMLKLDHPAIIKIRDPECSDGDHQFFVMEYVEGSNLEQAILAQKIPQSRILATLIAVGRALELAHGRQMIHRDVKPSNIIIDIHGRPRLTDFDLVRAADTTGGTRQGGMGTFVYSAPEMYQDANTADERADIFGLGMTGVFAFLGRSLPLEVLRNEQEVFAKLGCSGTVKEALRRAIRWSPHGRYATMAEFCSALEAAGKGQIWRSRGQKREVLALSVGAVGLLGFILVVPTLNSDSDAAPSKPDRHTHSAPASTTDKQPEPQPLVKTSAVPQSSTTGAVQAVTIAPTAPIQPSLEEPARTATTAPPPKPKIPADRTGNTGSIYKPAPAAPKGPLTPKGPRLTLAEQQTIIRECDKLEGVPGCSGASVKVRLTLDATNIITEAAVLAPYTNTDVGDCVKKRLERGGFIMEAGASKLSLECDEAAN